jgi:ADP-L-glycero-D-manno-heptose 6-epimerase
MRILVTGGGGFIGRAIVKELISQGHEVTITASGTDFVVPGVKKILYMGLDGIDWNYLHGQEAVIHQMANNDTRCTDADEMWRANVEGPKKLFMKAAEFGCKRFVYASSTAVYGNSPAPYIEDKTPIDPLNPYARSKAIFDQEAKKMASFGLSIIGLRYCNVYGPGEGHKGKRKSMVGQIIDKLDNFTDMYEQTTVKLFKPGDNKRDWLYVNDAVQANMLALAKTAQENYFNIFNVGSGEARSFNDILNVLNELIKNNHWEIKPDYIDCPFPKEYQWHTECDIKKIREELGYSPRFNLESGIKDYLISDI